MEFEVNVSMIASPRIGTVGDAPLARQFLGRTQLPPEVSALAISEFFTLSGAETQAVLSRYGVDMRFGAALQIGFLKTCGRPLDKLQRRGRALHGGHRYLAIGQQPVLTDAAVSPPNLRAVHDGMESLSTLDGIRTSAPNIAPVPDSENFSRRTHQICPGAPY